MRSLCKLALLDAAAAAQNVLTVVHGGFAQIADANVAAAPGDVVHIAPGTYRPIVLKKGITLRAIGANAVNVAPDAGRLDTTVHVPAGQHARISGLTFLPGTGPGHVFVSRGLVSLDACSKARDAIFKRTVSSEENSSMALVSAASSPGTTNRPPPSSS